MTRSELVESYFNWMYQLVSDKSITGNRSYRKLFRFLHSVMFSYSVERDDNRAGDGESLRYLFGYETGVDDRYIALWIDDKPCSVLEMMVALANRCETSIMYDSDYGDRTGQWFWGMVENLGLMDQYDSRFDETVCESIISRFINREYEPDGTGGLFTVRTSPFDMRNIEIWSQMNWYLTENYLP